MSKTQTNPNSLRQGTINVLKYSKARKGFALNPKGRGKSSFTILVNEIEKQGFEPVTRDSVAKACSFLIGMDEETLTVLERDPTQPVAIRIIIRNLLEGIKKGGMYWVANSMLESILVGSYANRLEREKEESSDVIQNVTINVVNINDRKQSPGFTGVTGVPKELQEPEKNSGQ